MFLTPPVITDLAKHPAVEQYDLSSLRSILCAAAPLGAELEQMTADRLGCDITELTIRDGHVLRHGAPTEKSYWSLAPLLHHPTATGSAPRKDRASYTIVGHSTPRLDLPAKVFGQPIFIHDLKLDGGPQG